MLVWISGRPSRKAKGFPFKKKPKKAKQNPLRFLKDGSGIITPYCREVWQQMERTGKDEGKLVYAWWHFIPTRGELPDRSRNRSYPFSLFKSRVKG
jgi:hypothetical protein